MRYLSTLLVALLLPLLASAQSWNEAQYKQIEQSIRMPQFADREFVITKFGASEKASAARNQKAINAAIAACSKRGGGRVVVPRGLWLTGAVRLQSGVNLVIEEGATLKFAFEPKLYPW
jgi:polygalacturonase